VGQLRAGAAVGFRWRPALLLVHRAALQRYASRQSALQGNSLLTIINPSGAATRRIRREGSRCCWTDPLSGASANRPRRPLSPCLQPFSSPAMPGASAPASAPRYALPPCQRQRCRCWRNPRLALFASVVTPPRPPRRSRNQNRVDVCASPICRRYAMTEHASQPRSSVCPAYATVLLVLLAERMRDGKCQRRDARCLLFVFLIGEFTRRSSTCSRDATARRAARRVDDAMRRYACRVFDAALKSV